MEILTDKQRNPEVRGALYGVVFVGALIIAAALDVEISIGGSEESPNPVAPTVCEDLQMIEG